MRTMLKMAGGGDADETSLQEFIVQAEEYREGGDVADQVFKVLNLLGRTHPFYVLRVAERPVPQPGPGEALIEVAAAAVLHLKVTRAVRVGSLRKIVAGKLRTISQAVSYLVQVGTCQNGAGTAQ